MDAGVGAFGPPGFVVEFGQPAAFFGVLHDDEVPLLVVAAVGRADGGLHNVVHHFGRDGVFAETADGALGEHSLPQGDDVETVGGGGHAATSGVSAVGMGECYHHIRRGNTGNGRVSFAVAGLGRLACASRSPGV